MRLSVNKTIINVICSEIYNKGSKLETIFDAKLPAILDFPLTELTFVNGRGFVWTVFGVWKGNCKVIRKVR